MKVKMYEGCNLYMIDKKTFEFKTVDPEKVDVTFDNNKKPTYKHKEKCYHDNMVIVQAFNHRYALSRAYEIIKNERIKN